MPAAPVALGFKIHTGWAAVVAARRPQGHAEILLRRRIELLPPDGSVPRFVYHQAAELPIAEASRLIKRAARAAQEAAHDALATVLEELRDKQVTIEAAGIATGSTAVPSDLKSILAAHTLIHAAEGALFQEALAPTCEARGLAVTRVRERDLWLQLGQEAQRELDSLRGLIGPPWGADQKTAAGAALVALSPVGPGLPARRRASARRGL